MIEYPVFEVINEMQVQKSGVVSGLGRTYVCICICHKSVLVHIKKTTTESKCVPSGGCNAEQCTESR